MTMVAMMITMMKIANDNDDDLFCVTLLFWNLLAFLLLLIVAHLFWHLGEHDGGEHDGDHGDADGDEEEEEDV